MNARCVLAIVSLVAINSPTPQGPSNQTGTATTTPCPYFGSTPETRGKLVTPTAVLHQVPPKYPPDARKSHIEGIVVLCVTIGKDGSAVNVRAISGPKELVASAVEAVQHSRFRPFLANGEPAEAAARVLVNFRLTGIQVSLT
jgi:protein TonB